MVMFGIVELQCIGNSVQNCRRDAGKITTFHPRIVFDTHAREHGHLFPPQSGDTTTPAADDVRLFRGDSCPPGTQEVACLRSVIHAVQRRHIRCRVAGLAWLSKRRNWQFTYHQVLPDTDRK